MGATKKSLVVAAASVFGLGLIVLGPGVYGFELRLGVDGRERFCFARPLPIGEFCSLRPSVAVPS